MSQICGMLKNPVITWKLGHRQNLPAISRPISSLVNRGLWRLRGVERLWIWRKELREVHRGPVASRPRCIRGKPNRKPVYLSISITTILSTNLMIYTQVLVLCILSINNFAKLHGIP
jgi:hypothetical protein